MDAGRRAGLAGSREIKLAFLAWRRWFYGDRASSLVYPGGRRVRRSDRPSQAPYLFANRCGMLSFDTRTAGGRGCCAGVDDSRAFVCDRMLYGDCRAVVHGAGIRSGGP